MRLWSVGCLCRAERFRRVIDVRCGRVGGHLLRTLDLRRPSRFSFAWGRLVVHGRCQRLDGRFCDRRQASLRLLRRGRGSLDDDFHGDFDKGRRLRGWCKRGQTEKRPRYGDVGEQRGRHSGCTLAQGTIHGHRPERPIKDGRLRMGKGRRSALQRIGAKPLTDEPVEQHRAELSLVAWLGTTDRRCDRARARHPRAARPQGRSALPRQGGRPNRPPRARPTHPVVWPASRARCSGSARR